MIKVQVPATGANMEAEFDCLGIALSPYNTIIAEETDSGIFIENRNLKEYIPSAENNLIYRAMEAVFEKTGYQKCGVRIMMHMLSGTAAHVLQ